MCHSHLFACSGMELLLSGLLFLERKFEIEKLSKVHNVVIFLLSQSMEFDKIL
jgi:hypothetical protein